MMFPDTDGFARAHGPDEPLLEVSPYEEPPGYDPAWDEPPDDFDPFDPMGLLDDEE